MSGKQMNTDATVGIKIDGGFVVFCWQGVFFFCLFFSNKLSFPCRDLCIRVDLETALVSGHPAPFLMVTFPCAPRGCSWCQEGPPAGSSWGSLPKNHLTSRAAEIRREIEYWVLIAHFQREGKTENKKMAVLCFPKLGLDYINSGAFYLWCRAEKHSVVSMHKKHPDILFVCLFGFVRTDAKHSSTHTAGKADMESLTTNLHVEEIP